MKGAVLLLLCAGALAHDAVVDLNKFGCPIDIKNEKLLPHECCDKFYKCTHGVPIKYACPPHLLFDTELQRCEWPYDVDCGDRIKPGGGGSNNSPATESSPPDVKPPICNCDPSEALEICSADDSDGALVANEKCNKYYICDHGIPVSRNCPAGLLYNPPKEICDYPENVYCGDRSIPDSSEDNGSEGGNNSGEDNNNNNGTVICNCNPSEAPLICAGSGSESVLIANEHCNKYYICNYGVPVARPCPSGLLYNAPKQICDHPDNVECGDRIIPESSESESNEINGGNNGNSENSNENNGNGSNNSTVVCNCNPGEAPAICAGNGSESVLIANEHCNKYYICNFGVPVAQTCPSGLLYNAPKQICDHPEQVDCGDRIIHVSSESESDESGDVNHGNNENSNENNGDGSQNNGHCDPSEAPAICAIEGSIGVLVANEKCNKYYICNHGKPVSRRCPRGTLYNAPKEICDHPSNVDCGDRIIPGDSDEEDNEGDVNGNGGADGNNGGGDNNNNNGTVVCNCNPGAAPAICAGNGSESVLIANEHCNKYYICNFGVPVAQTCPSGLLYNAPKQICDHPENVDCGDRIISVDSNEENNGGDGNGIGGEDANNGGGDNNNSTVDCNCKPGEAPVICAGNGSESVLIANEHCNKYYICNYGVPVARPCPSGLLYNALKQICDHPENVDCGDRIIPESSESESNESNGSNNGNSENSNENNGNGSQNNGHCDPSEAPAICAAEGSNSILVANEKCNKYYICNHGIPVPRRCPRGTLYNAPKAICDHPSNVDCGDRIIPGDSDEEDNGGDENGSIGEDGNNGGGNNNNNNGTVVCNCSPGEAPAICAVSGSESVLIANEHCNKYYICNYGVPVAQPCPSGLLYNALKQICDHPENVDCGDRIIPESSESESNESNGSNNGNSENSNENNGNGSQNNGHCDPSEAPAICAAEGSNSILVANEKCNKYYICNHGIPVPRRCPRGTLYNAPKAICDHPSNVDCGDRIIPGDSDEEDNGGDENGSIGEGGNNGGGNNNNNNGTVVCNCSPGEAPAICTVSGSESVLIANEHCNKYYICNNGVPVARPCPSGLLYNAPKQICDHPENVDCGDRIITEESGEGNNGGDENGSGGEDGNNSGEDNNNNSTVVCNCNPGEAPAICAVSGSESVLIANEHCNKYYICNYGVPVARPCPSGLLYNAPKQICDHPENVDCGDRIITEESGEGNNGGDENGSGGEDGNNGGEDNNNNSTVVCNCNPGEAPAICAVSGSESVLIANEHCNKYYICNNGVPVARACPSGLLYNAPKQICDHPENVYCGDRIIPEEGDEENNVGDENGSSGEDGNNGGEDNNSTIVCNCNPGEAPAICAGNGSESVLIANEHCNKYYICNYGVPVAQTCPSGLLYNAPKQICDHPEKVYCGDRIILDSSESESNESEGEKIENSNENNANGVNTDPGEAPAICAAEGSNSVLVANENCNKFYICLNGVPVPRNCPYGLLYNADKEACDWPQNVNCGNRIIPQENIDDDSNSESKTSEEHGENENGSTGNTTCNCNPGEASSICASVGGNNMHVASEKCNKYYVCSAGVPIERPCSPGLLYNPVLEICDWPRNVECGDRIISDETEEISETTKEEAGSGGWGHSDPSLAPVICAATGSEGVFVAHQYCNYFYTCSGGAPVSFKCSTPLLYNPAHEDCDWPTNVRCGDRVISKESSEEYVSEEVESGNGASADWNEAPAICAAPGSDGVLVAHQNCCRYYICTGGQPVPRDCPTYLQFNPKKNVCDYPSFVSCGNRFNPLASNRAYARKYI